MAKLAGSHQKPHCQNASLNIPSHDHRTSDSLGPDELDASHSGCQVIQIHQAPCVFELIFDGGSSKLVLSPSVLHFLHKATTTHVLRRKKIMLLLGGSQWLPEAKGTRHQALSTISRPDSEEQFGVYPPYSLHKQFLSEFKEH